VYVYIYIYILNNSVAAN